MKLKFWSRREKVVDTVNELNTQIGKMNEQIEKMNEQMEKTNEQLQKLARLQYKTSQEILNKIGNLSLKTDKLQIQQEAYEQILVQNKERQDKLQELGKSLIGWLDDIDHVCAGLGGEGRETWYKLLNQWAEQLLDMLASAGIYELKLLGHTFNPSWAESIGTVVSSQLVSTVVDDANSQSLAPYEIVEVVKRGFVYSDGSLLRKAQVITFQEEDLHEKCQ